MMIEKIKAWLQAYPGWEGTLTVDSAGAIPLSCGLFPQGVTELRRQEDVLGNLAIRCRAEFLLVRVSLGREADAAWLLDFQSWVRQQSIAGTVPVLGGNTWVEARNGKKKEGNLPGQAGHTIRLVAEYTVKTEG